MRRGTRQSQLINNWFSLATIILVSITLTLYVKYIVKKPPRLHSSLECQLNTNTYDKIINAKLLNIQASLIKEGRYVLDGGILEVLNQKSLIKEKIKISQMDRFFMQELNIFASNRSKKFVKIKYELIENEKDAQSPAVLKTSFRINGKEGFIMNTDLLSYNETTIKAAVSCTIKAFNHNVTKN